MKLREQKKFAQTPLEEMWDLQSEDKGFKVKEDKLLLYGVLQILTRRRTADLDAARNIGVETPGNCGNAEAAAAHGPF